MIKKYFKDPIDNIFNLIALLSVIVLFFSILKYFVVDDYFKFFYLKYLIVFFIFTFLIFLLRIFLSKSAKTYFSILIFLDFTFPFFHREFQAVLEKKRNAGRGLI